MEKIFQASVALFGNKALEDDVVVDTTVQEKNITFPTDTRLRVKTMERCWKIAEEEGLVLRRSYRRELKHVRRVIRLSRSRKKEDRKKVAAAIRRVKTMANALLRDVARKLPDDIRMTRKDELDLCRQAINRQRQDKDKIYSLHEPRVCCIAKGKEHKKYEFGAKAAITMTKNHRIIVGVKSFSRNEYDGDTLKTVLPQAEEIRGKAALRALCDRGFRGRKRAGTTAILLPESPSPKATEYARRKARKDFGRRSAIEPVTSHLKYDFRLARNYLKGTIGDTMNLLMAAAAFNCAKWMRAVAQSLFFVLATLWAITHRDDEPVLTTA